MTGLDDQSIKLANFCHEAFLAYPNSCSHSVWYVIGKYQPSQPYMMANELIEFLDGSPEWREVAYFEVAEAARMGKLVVGGLKGKVHGHVVVVYPGREKPRGGYLYTPRSTGISRRLATKGMYPLAMSTSMGTFPGSKSNGDKTVWDAWGSDVSFQQVRYWEYKGEVKNRSLRPLRAIRWNSEPVLLRQKQQSNASTPGARWRMETNPNSVIGKPDIRIRWQR